MIQSSRRFGLAASSPTLSESSLFGWVGCGPLLRCAHRRTVRARSGLTAHPPNWIQTNLTTRRRNKLGLVGLIESSTQGVGAPSQTPFRRGVWGGSPQRALGGAPAWVWGRSPHRVPTASPPLWLLSYPSAVSSCLERSLILTNAFCN